MRLELEAILKFKVKVAQVLCPKVSLHRRQDFETCAGDDLCTRRKKNNMLMLARFFANC